jgi:hypothetical protein
MAIPIRVSSEAESRIGRFGIAGETPELDSIKKGNNNVLEFDDKYSKFRYCSICSPISDRAHTTYGIYQGFAT